MSIAQILLLTLAPPATYLLLFLLLRLENGLLDSAGTAAGQSAEPAASAAPRPAQLGACPHAGCPRQREQAPAARTGRAPVRCPAATARPRRAQPETVREGRH